MWCDHHELFVRNAFASAHKSAHNTSKKHSSFQQVHSHDGVWRCCYIKYWLLKRGYFLQFKCSYLKGSVLQQFCTAKKKDFFHKQKSCGFAAGVGRRPNSGIEMSFEFWNSSVLIKKSLYLMSISFDAFKTIPSYSQFACLHALYVSNFTLWQTLRLTVHNLTVNLVTFEMLHFENIII